MITTSRSNDVLQPAQGWLELPSPRIPVPLVSEWGWLLRCFLIVARFFKRPDLPNIFPVLHLNPNLFWAWLFFASRLMPFGRLPGKVREKVILRVAWQSRCRYEWVQHLDLALAIGVSDEDIVALSIGVDAKGSEVMNREIDKIVMLACEQMLKNKMLNDACWQSLEKHFSKKQMIELMILIGHYDMLAGFLINAGVETEAHVELKLQKFNEGIIRKFPNLVNRE